MNKIRILCIGDIFGKAGRRAITNLLPKIKKDYNIDFTIANAENTTHCKGLNLKHYNLLVNSGIDFFTMGNHTWNKHEIIELLETKNNIIRPYNLTETYFYNQYGVGTKVIDIKGFTFRITNLLGLSVRFNNNQTNPFIALDIIIKNNLSTDFHIIDFHAETTSEKNTLLYAFKNKVSLIYGTHTHVQTADAKIVDNTAYITDVGMTGPSEGIIGCDGNIIMNKFINNEKSFNIEEHVGKYQFCGIIVDFDTTTKTPTNIERIYINEN